MTEEQWLTCEEPADMVEFLRGRVSDRALRLFAVACCRWAWDYLGPTENQQVVETVEECIDQLFGDVGRGLAALSAIRGKITFEGLLVRDLAQDDAWEAAHSVAFRVPRTAWTRESETWSRGYKAVSQIVREVFGNPFRPPSFDPAWRTPQVRAAAKAGYSNRALPGGELEPPGLGALVEALVAAGCNDAAVLDHLRSPGRHVRGCWAVELLAVRSSFVSVGIQPQAFMATT